MDLLVIATAFRSRLGGFASHIARSGVSIKPEDHGGQTLESAIKQANEVKDESKLAETWIEERGRRATEHE